MSEEFVRIGWIAHGMDKTRVDHYKSIFAEFKVSVRVPPKIYKTESVAARYGTPVAVYIRKEK